MQTIREFLLANFGDSTNRIVNLDHWADQTFESAHFTIYHGGLCVSCGGTAIIAFDKKNHRPVYLVIDNSDGDRWAARKQALEAKYQAGGRANDSLTPDEWREWHASRPFDKLRLVQSA